MDDSDYDEDDSRSAPVFMLQPTSLTSIEMPGPVTEASLPLVIDALGGPRQLAGVLESHADNPAAVTSVPELHLRPEQPFAHPVTGNIAETSNILLKVTKRRRKIRRINSPEVNGEGSSEGGVFSVESMGVINRTIRFRDLADYQYQPVMDDDIVRLTEAMRKLEVPPLLAYSFPEAVEEDVDDLKLFPPAVFSRVSLPQQYGFKRNPQTKPETVTNAQGEEIERLRNTTRYAIVPPQAIGFNDPTPTRPPEGVKEGTGTEETLIKRLKELLAQRPIWTRQSLLNQLSLDHYRVVVYQKQALPFLTYTFSEGPYRELVVRLGYDPRRYPQSRFYQRIQLRSTLSSRSNRVATAQPAGHGKGGIIAAGNDPRTDLESHIFNGHSMQPNNVGTYQLCDLTDPVLHELTHEPRFFRSTCHPNDGFWVREFMDHLRNILKRKFNSLALNEGPVNEEDLQDDIDRMRRIRTEEELLAAASDSEDKSRSDSDVSSRGGEARTKKARIKSIRKAKKPSAKKAEGERKRPELLGKAPAGTIDDEEPDVVVEEEGDEM